MIVNIDGVHSGRVLEKTPHRISIFASVPLLVQEDNVDPGKTCVEIKKKKAKAAGSETCSDRLGRASFSRFSDSRKNLEL